MEVQKEIKKRSVNMQIAFWFLSDLYIRGEISQKEIGIIETAYSTEILAETEKACHIKFLSELGVHEMWIPKKCILQNKYKRVKVKLPKWLANNKQLPNTELKGQLIEETDKAIYFRYRADLATWLPKSQITIEEIN